MGIKRTLSCFLSFALLMLFANPLVVNAATTEQIIFHHTDFLSGTNIDTDANGNIIEAVDYYPFGEIRVDQKATTYENKHKFTGKEFDKSDGLYYYGARYYDPSIGRFISADPMDGDLSNPQSLNKYSYVMNNPLRYIDPTGMFFRELWNSFLSTLDMAPITGDVSDLYVAHYGKTLFTQEDLSSEDIDLTIAMAMLPLATGGQMRMAREVEEETNKVRKEVFKTIDKWGEKTSVEAGASKGGLNLFKSGEDEITTSKASGWKEGDRMLNLPNQGSPKANWKQNASILRKEMGNGNPIFDSYRDGRGTQIIKGVFLRAERYVLANMGWKYNSATGAYHPPLQK